MDRGSRISIEVEGYERVKRRTTVEWTEARNERAGWAARTPDIESEERNAEIGINSVERKPGCAGTGRRENRTNDGDGDEKSKTENPKRSHKSGERTTTGIR